MLSFTLKFHVDKTQYSTIDSVFISRECEYILILTHHMSWRSESWFYGEAAFRFLKNITSDLNVFFTTSLLKLKSLEKRRKVNFERLLRNEIRRASTA